MKNTALSLIALLAFVVTDPAANEPVYYPGSTRKMFQVTGDYDQTLRLFTRSMTQTRAGVISTDLGSSFEHNGKLYFLFGDTFGADGSSNKDVLAFTDATDAEDLDLSFHLDTEGQFLPISIRHVSQGAYEVPSYGISVNGSIYIVHTTDWNASAGNMERSVLARSDDDGRTWNRLYTLSSAVDHDMSNAHFINVSMAKVQAEDFPGDLPVGTDEIVLIWGSGAYRKSNVYLAYIPADQIEDRSALRFLAGYGSDGFALWSTQEESSIPLFEQPYIGEFSTAWIEPLQRWLMLYNASNPRGITMRSAPEPWGPYSAGQIIMEPWRDGAYGSFLHVPWNWVRLDAFHDPGRHNEWGGEYGPYLIPRFSRGNSDQCFIYYTLSTWNPYQTILARSTVGEYQPSGYETEAVTLTPGGDGWTNSPPDFFNTITVDTRPFITTYTEQGDAATGITWTWLPRDNKNGHIEFQVRGGAGEVLLIEGGGDIPTTESAQDIYPRIKSGEFGQVVHCIWGQDTNDVRIPASWSLLPFESENLKVVVIDHLPEQPWGFIDVSEIVLTRLVNEPDEVNMWEAY